MKIPGLINFSVPLFYFLAWVKKRSLFCMDFNENGIKNRIETIWIPNK